MKKKDLVLDYIYDNIEKGIWKPEKRILGECDIAKRLGVSRNTVREALHELEKKDIIYKVNGSGSFVKKQNQKKILITFDSAILSYVRRNLFTKIADLIEYSSYDLEIVNINEEIKTELENIDGIINVAADYRHYNFKKIDNIPLVNVMTFTFSDTPGVVFNLADMYNKFFGLVKGHKDTLFVDFDLWAIMEWKEKETVSDFYDDCYNICMKGLQSLVNDLYNQIKIPLYDDFSEIEENLDKEFAKIKKPPYAIVFCDDFLYAKAYPLFHKYDRIFKNTKIITHSNGFKMETEPYTLTKVEFDLDEVAQASVDLLISLMNKEPGGKRNAVINPKIIE